MTYRSCWAAVLVVASVAIVPAAAIAAQIEYELTFETSGQSIWGSGDSFQMQSSKFLGAEWQDKTAGLDLIAGTENANLLNPLRVAYDVSFAGCRALGFSSNACINGQRFRAAVPALGSRPSVRSCGKFDVACGVKRLGDLSKRGAYDLAYKACRLGFSASVCRNGQSGRAPFFALGTAPPEYLNVDTRTGVAVNSTSDGKVGLELALEIDSGSVDATVSYEATLDIPDTTTLDKANPINFNANSVLAGTNTLDTMFSSMELSVDAIMKLSGSVGTEACIVPTGCATGASPIDIDEIAPILSFNRNGDGEILFLGQTPSDLGIPNVDGLPASLDIAGLATATLHLPQPNASGGVDASGQKLTAVGQDDLADLSLDLDNIVATAAGLPGLFGRSFDLPFVPGSSIGFDIIDVQMGPGIDLKQEFELDPTLLVSLEFDEQVMIAGQLVTTWLSEWNMLPDIMFLSDVTNVTPTFILEADLQNRTLLDVDLNFSIDLLQVLFDFGLLGEGSFGIGNVLTQGADLFESPDFFSSLFALGGWNLLQGDSFVIDFLAGSSGALPDPGTRSFIDPIILPANPDPVPEPATVLIVAFGLIGLHALRRRSAPGSRIRLG